MVAPSTPNKADIAVGAAGGASSDRQVEEEIAPQPAQEDVGSRRNARETAEALVRLLLTLVVNS